jgi:hypothetical protein
MKILFLVYRQYYADKGKSGIDFLRDAVNYLDARNESLNADKTIFKLLTDWAKRVQFNNSTRF